MTKIKSLDDLSSVRSYLMRIGAEVRSIKTAVVKEISGSYWRDVAIIHVNKDGTIKCPEAYTPTELEAAAMRAEILGADWPSLRLTRNLENAPAEIKTADGRDVFEFRGVDNRIVMLQLRKATRDGGKAYIPFTFWDDEEWRRAEPDGPLPLWGMERLGDQTTVFIHEGAKAARAMSDMVEAKTPEMKRKLAQHPWGEELSNAAHLGWIGGALSPSRTDWAQLKKSGVKRAYIVSDNDAPGVAAVPSISQHLGITCFHVQFTNDWPPSFDLADEFPAKFFSEIEGRRMYFGPSFRSCLHPATWATDLIPNPRGKPTIVLREHFKDLWVYVEEADLFVCTEMPEILRGEQILNKMLAGFSHTFETARLLNRAYRGRNTRLCYRPDTQGRIITDKTTSAVNLHTPTTIKSIPGSARPFLDFLDYLLPLVEERKEVMRWIATLIAKPETRMEYGLLLVSETQGVGKTTLGSSILAPLVGVQNVGWPSESDIVDSNFNDWVAHKRLVVVNEIYAGHSSKAYNQLKSLITDNEVQVNQKYQRRYTLENWVHLVACSNSLKALKMEGDDRRWFYPQVTEARWPREKFGALREWLSGGGLSIIRHWAENFGDYVLPGERAPMTQAKIDLIEASRSEACSLAAQLALAAGELTRPAALSLKSVVSYARSQVQGKIYDTDYELRKSMTEAGMSVFGSRMKINGFLQFVLINNILRHEIERLPESEQKQLVKTSLISPMDVIQGVI